MVAPFGEDAVVQFHRQISPVATLFILAHPLLLMVQDASVIGLFNPITAPWRARFAVISAVCLLAIVLTSAWRRRLRLRYVQMSIKALGDFTRSIAELRPGARAYLDGPHGVFTPDRNEGPGFVLIAGGIGIASVFFAAARNA